MMFRLRFAVMWVLLVALPLQGYAAATMLNCGPNHHRMMATAIAEPVEAHEHTAAGQQHHHEMSVAAGEHEIDSVDHSGEAPLLPHLDKLAKFKCSACAVCCTGVAMPTAAFTFKPLLPAMAPEFFVSIWQVGFVTGGPDRPPRLSHL